MLHRVTVIVLVTNVAFVINGDGSSLPLAARDPFCLSAVISLSLSIYIYIEREIFYTYVMYSVICVCYRFVFCVLYVFNVRRL